MRLAEHVVRTRAEMHTALLLENIKEIDHLEDLGVDGRMSLWVLLRKNRGVAWILLELNAVQRRGLFDTLCSISRGI